MAAGTLEQPLRWRLAGKPGASPRKPYNGMSNGRCDQQPLAVQIGTMLLLVNRMP